MTDLVIVVYLIGAVSMLFILIRSNWVYNQRMKWVGWVHEFNMREIERVACEDPFALKYLSMETGARYSALLSYDKCLLKVFTWSLDGLVSDRRAYEEVMRFHEQRKETLQ